MKTYFVSGVITISVSVEVRANSPEEAKEKARQAPLQGLCHQCASGEEGCWSTSGELDGEVTEIRVEE